jgi:hypothetical protein
MELWEKGRERAKIRERCGHAGGLRLTQPFLHGCLRRDRYRAVLSKCAVSGMVFCLVPTFARRKKMTFRELVESTGGREMSGPDDRRPEEMFFRMSRPARVRSGKRYFAWPASRTHQSTCPRPSRRTLASAPISLRLQLAPFQCFYAGTLASTVRQNEFMPRRQCHHCKEWIEEGEAHDCWKTTEAALTGGLTEELRDAWMRIRETAAGFGEQRIYASGKAIMFARTSCYFFVRPKRQFLQVCVFLGRPIKAPQVRRVDPVSKSKLVHVIHIAHRDEVEAPVTDWLREAYEVSNSLSKARDAANATVKRKTSRRARRKL